MQGGLWFLWSVCPLFGYRPDAPFRRERGDAVSDQCQRSPWLAGGSQPPRHCHDCSGEPERGRQAVPSPKNGDRKISKKKKKKEKPKPKIKSQNPATKPQESGRGGGSGARVNPQILRVQQPGEGEAQPAARSPLPALRSVLPGPAGAHPRRPGRAEAAAPCSPAPGRPRRRSHQLCSGPRSGRHRR